MNEPEMPASPVPDSESLPSGPAVYQRLLRAAATLALLALVLLTVYLSAGRLLVPRISTQQSAIENQLSRTLGIPVTLTGLKGRWFHFTPQLEVATLTIAAPDAQPQQIKGLILAIDVWESLKLRQLAIASLSVEGLDLVVVQNPGGRWGLEGLAPGQVDYTPQIVEALLRTPNLELHESNLELRPLNQPPIALNSVFIHIQNSGDNHQLDLQFRFQNQPSPSQILVDIQGNPYQQVAGQAWLSFPDLDLQPVLQALVPDSWQLDQVQFSSEFWVRFDEQGSITVQGQLENMTLAGSNKQTAQQLSLTNTALTMQAQRGAGGDWSLQLADVALDWNNTPWDFPVLVITRPDGASPAFTVQAASVELGLLGALALDAAPLPEAGRQALRILNPRGEIHNLLVESAFDGSYPQGFRLRANLQEVAVEPWNAIPGGTGLDFYLELNGVNGFAEVDSRDMTLSLPLLFTSSWQYDHVNSRINWDVSQGRVHVYSSVIEVDSSDLQGRLAFDVLNTTDAESNHESQFKLAVGVSSMEVLPGKVYLPYVPQVAEVMSWLGDALQGGTLHDSAFIFRNSIKNAREISSTSLSWYQTDGGVLKFLPEWPALQDITAAVVVRDNQIDITSAGGDIAGMPIHSATAKVRPAPEGSLLSLQASSSTDTATGHRFLLDSPLHDTIGAIFDTWEPSGELATQLSLALPLGGNPGAQDIQVDVTSTGSTLTIPEYSLQFTDVQGQVRYTSAGGLQARDLSATLFGFPVIASIDSQATSANHQLTSITGTGHARLEDLRNWEAQPVFISRLLNHTQGELDYDLRLDFPGVVSADGTSTRLTLSSSLVGVASQLPEPFAKPADQQRQLSLEYGFSEAGAADLLNLKFADFFTGQIVLDTRGIRRGQLSFGERNRSFTVRQSDSTTAGLLVTGDLDGFDYDAWEAVAQTLVSDDQDARSLKEALRLIDVNVQAFSVRGEVFDAINLQVQPEADAWQVTAHNSLLGGVLRIPDMASQPWQADLDYLRFPATPPRSPEEQAAAEELDLLESIDPTALPPLNFRTAQLMVGESNLGELRFELRPTDFGAEIRHLWMIDDDSRVSGENETDGASIDWEFRNGFHSSRFTGLLAAGDLAKVMPDWGHDAFVVSNSARFAGSLGWPGSPLAFSLKRSSGQLDILLVSGRFVDIDSGSSRLLGAFNFDALIRRLQLDFTDLFQRGFAYDRITGDLGFNNGVIATNDTLTIDGPSSRLRINGEINLRDETIAADMLVRIPLGQNISMLAGLLGAWPIALSTYVASKIFAEQVDDFTTIVYRLDGPWANVDAGFEAPTEVQEVPLETQETISPNE